MARTMGAGRAGEKTSVLRLRHPSGTVTTTSSDSNVPPSVLMTILGFDSSLWLSMATTLVDRWISAFLRAFSATRARILL